MHQSAGGKQGFHIAVHPLLADFGAETAEIVNQPVIIKFGGSNILFRFQIVTELIDRGDSVKSGIIHLIVLRGVTHLGITFSAFADSVTGKEHYKSRMRFDHLTAVCGNFDATACPTLTGNLHCAVENRQEHGWNECRELIQEENTRLANHFGISGFIIDPLSGFIVKNLVAIGIHFRSFDERLIQRSLLELDEVLFGERVNHNGLFPEEIGAVHVIAPVYLKNLAKVIALADFADEFGFTASGGAGQKSIVALALQSLLHEAIHFIGKFGHHILMPGVVALNRFLFLEAIHIICGRGFLNHKTFAEETFLLCLHISLADIFFQNFHFAVPRFAHDFVEINHFQPPLVC